MAVSWDNVRDRFDFTDLPGALLDLLVLDTSIENFQQVMDLVRVRHEWRYRYLEDGSVVPMPATAVEAFERAEQLSAVLELDPAGIYVRGYFNFGSDRIEFDLDPAEINSAERFAVLAEMMSMLGQTTGKVVIAAPEGLTHAPLVRYNPELGDLSVV